MNVLHSSVLHSEETCGHDLSPKVRTCTHLHTICLDILQSQGSQINFHGFSKLQNHVLRCNCEWPGGVGHQSGAYSWSHLSMWKNRAPMVPRKNNKQLRSSASTRHGCNFGRTLQVPPVHPALDSEASLVTTSFGGFHGIPHCKFKAAKQKLIQHHSDSWYNKNQLTDMTSCNKKTCNGNTSNHVKIRLCRKQKLKIQCH
jgi:hypothetical protein